MASGWAYIDTGATLPLATNTISEDALTKHIGRSILNDSSGVELATAAAPFKVNLVAIGSGTLATITTVGSVGVVGSISSVGALVTVTGTINTVSTVATVASVTSCVTVGTVANIASVGALVSVASINTVNTLLQFAKTVKSRFLIYSAAAETDFVERVAAKKIKVIAFSVINASTAANTVTFKDATTGNTVWSIPFVPQGVQGANVAVSFPSYIFSSNGTNTPIAIAFASAVTAHISLSYVDDDAV